jgi:hypothetical protein
MSVKIALEKHVLDYTLPLKFAKRVRVGDFYAYPASIVQSLGIEGYKSPSKHNIAHRLGMLGARFFFASGNLSAASRFRVKHPDGSTWVPRFLCDLT